MKGNNSNTKSLVGIAAVIGAVLAILAAVIATILALFNRWKY